MNNSEILELVGLPYIQNEINLTSGWNLIGYPSLEEKNITDITMQLNDSLDSIFAYYATDIGNEWKSYSPSRPDLLNTLKTMKPGFGYWVKVNRTVSLTIS